MGFLTATAGQTIPPNFDGAIRSTLSCKADYIVKDAGNEFAISYLSSSLQVSVASGVGIIGGISIMSSAANTITLAANTTTYLCLRIDRGQVEGSEGLLYANTSSSIKQDTIFNGSGQRDLLLAIVTTDSNGVTGLTDERVIVDSITGVGLGSYEVLQVSDMDAGDTCICKYSNSITSATSSDSTKASVTYMGNSATITAVASGTCTITIVENSTTHTIPVSVN